MKLKLLILFCSMALSIGFAQNHNGIDSLKLALKSANTDSAKFSLHFKIYREYVEFNNDSALYHVEQQIAIAEQNNMKLAQADGLETKGYVLQRFGKYAESLQTLNQALGIAKNPINEIRNWYPDSLGNPHEFRLRILGYIQLDLGHVMGSTNNTETQVSHYKEAIRVATEINGYELLGLASMNLGSVYLYTLNELDSAIQMQQTALKSFQKGGHKKWLSTIFGILGEIYLRKKENKMAVDYFQKAIQASYEVNNLENVFLGYLSLTDHYINQQNRDSSLFYAHKAGELIRLQPAALTKNSDELYYILLSKSYKLNNKVDSAYKYLNLAYFLKDSSYQAQIKNLTDVQKILFEERTRAEKSEKEKIAFQNRIRQYTLLGGFGVVMIVALLLYRNNIQKQKANIELEKTLGNLTATQTQLIQKEKLASLGELTAGIAHEIQNPLNFVNNFSELSVDLVKDLKDEIEKPDIDKEYVGELFTDLASNQQKINHHGKRASNIVKGMLEHSRSSTGVKEPTDINKLVDESIRLSYHAMRAKDKNFNADYTMDLDEAIGKINIIPQDMGRVLINLFNNAFYAVNQRKLLSTDENYTPSVSVTTKQLEKAIEIRVKDNGNGIPDNVKQKIFQPFFTTKPTGEGTGLGLSLSYDIVVKGHGGSLEVESTVANPEPRVLGGEGVGTEFIIELPFRTNGR